MSSVTGSRLAFFNGTQTINLVLTATGATDLNGNPLAGDTISGAYNIEVFTSVAGGLASGYQASAFIEGANKLSGNEVQAGTIGSTEQVLQGSYSLLDQFGAETIQIIGAGGAGGDAVTVTGSGGDTITGSSNAGNTQLIDASNTNVPAINPGPETITGGAGNTTVWAASGDSVTAGAGAITVAGNAANNMTITGGTGDLQTFNFGTGNSITGATTGTTFIDDNYGGSHNIIFGGGGTGPVQTPNPSISEPFGTYIVAGTDDRIFGGSGTSLINAAANGTTNGSTITGGSGAAEVWAGVGESVVGATGSLFVAGDSGSHDTIEGGTTTTTVVGGASDSVIDGHGSLQLSGASTTLTTLTGGHGAITALNLGTGNDIGGATASGASTFIDDSYQNLAGTAFTGGSNTLSGGAGTSTVIAGPNDTVDGGRGALDAIFKSGLNSSVAVDLSSAAGRGAATLDDLDTRSGVESIAGSTGAHVTVSNFSTSIDSVASAGSVQSGGGTGPGAVTGVGASATEVSGNAVITFSDGSTLTLLNTNVNNVHFIQ